MSSDRNKEIMAANIKKYMERKGVTNQQLCDALGFKYTTFIDWTKGVTYPRMPKIEAMANYFGIKKSDLIEEKMPEENKKPTVTSERERKIMRATELLQEYSEEDLLWVIQMLEKMSPKEK